MIMINDCAPPVTGRDDPAWHRRATADGQLVSLRGGTQMLVRPIRATDAPLLADGFDRLSDQSRWSRFLAAKQELTAAELRYFTEIDHHDHEALIAVSTTDGRALGVARYVRSVDDRLAADVAVTVVDAWHRRGIATQLMTRLGERAAQAGIRRFAVLVSADNLPVFALIRRLGLEMRGAHAADGTVEGRVALPITVSPAGGTPRSERRRPWRNDRGSLPRRPRTSRVAAARLAARPAG